MPAVCRKGDLDNKDGEVSGLVADTVFINGIEAALVDSQIDHHPSLGRIVTGSSTVTVEGRQLAVVNLSLTECGQDTHVMVTGSDDVISDD